MTGDLITILSKIHSPADVKKISEKELDELCDEIRKRIIETVAKNGGHLASNLGVVELTVALHRVFDSPEDAIIFDVSHQCYTHKLLTGRYSDFSSLRKQGGISGFTRRLESPHDFFDNGHSSTSVSQALGLLTAWDKIEKEQRESGRNPKNRKVVAVIGDGALTGGLAYEALAHAGQLSKNLIVILNDNQMSISPNNGAISRYLSTLTMTGFYQRFRYFVDNLVDKIPNSKHHIGKFIYRIKRAVKGMFLSTNFFADLGFEYVGPLDGHNIKELEENLRRVRRLPKPVIVHVLTKKGKGYSPAENDPASFHGVGPFQISDGKMEKFDSLSFTEAFNHTIMTLAEKNTKIMAITAAMSKGTGLDTFARHYPDRFFDVGIAEEHAVTFASGLAAGGMIPIVAIYSTFIQRSIDQIIHDVAVSDHHVILCFDRSGAVPGDGETHQGIFDIALLRPIPNMTILSPATALDLSLCLMWAVNAKRPVAIRYPKLSCPSELPSFEGNFVEGRGVLLKNSEFAPNLSVNFDSELAISDEEKKTSRSAEKILLVCTGGILDECLVCARNLLQKGKNTDIYTLRFIKPLDESYFLSLAKKYDRVAVIEDGVKNGGIGEYLENLLFEHGFKNVSLFAFPEKFFSQGTRAQILEEAGLSAGEISKKLLTELKSTQRA
ncbi:MAG: 1-deoxy-D-xylulose-5-phosphate synthase [Treponema sp.]|uniref:1-deoxy-D-xylulose-5-phosphate synthase n=1 Tax=Treponema sp. TaxID=166 RepID=UPI0025FCD70A|nr:1-deoxy-D-xylulose-5-phosphate synthase [Treponema sp.]MBQ8679877.1 1-deoxy-D-xylulose-5-phosphate synthase [Treponema sp.]